MIVVHSMLLGGHVMHPSVDGSNVMDVLVMCEVGDMSSQNSLQSGTG